MKIAHPRTFLEIKVGQQQCVDVVLHIRRADISWFNEDKTPGNSKFNELLKLLEEKVIPRMFDDELEQKRAELNHEKVPPPLGPGGIPIAEKNEILKKRKRFNRKEAALELQRLEEEDKKRQKKELDIHYAFTDNMMITYRLHIIKDKRTETLVFFKDETETSFVPLHKLSRRLLLWCYPNDANGDPTSPDPPGGGFGRTELIPIADLFRNPSL
ncbi:hypothetical protein FisN_3Lh105 [Fistulifera solaris]|uniref:Uncharacterized protein n=1 Tax=Fistulifera solaris TaxID=1519565 RepID=A0A1Z5JZG6_FISSO|nr:hypothetical protein FisN_3Lh105 [Fistulifera solaris]|eukprot:GAX19161.1 hypothetical protein FisN_3Lh105 [Fistulifera solaris]